MPKPWEKAASATPQQPTSEPAPTGRKPWEKAARVFSGGQSNANPVAKTAPKPAPMSQPDATPWGDGQAFDDMYARKPQTDPMLSPLRPDARTLTSGQPSQLKVPTQRGPMMSPAQRRATQPARDAAVAQRTEQANRWKSDSPFGTPVDEMGMPIAVIDAQRDGGMYAVRDDVGKAIVASPIHAERALVGAAEATLNTPGDLGRSLAVPFAMGFDPASQGIVANLEFARDEASVANAMDRFATRYEQGGFRDAQEKIEAAPRFNFSAAKIPVPKELESVSGTLAEGFLQYLAARGALGKFMPGGKTLAQFAKDVGATGIGYSGDSPRAADMLDPESMGMLSDYVRWLKTQPGDTQGMGRFKNMAEDATINLLAMGLLRGGQATTNALNPQALTPTNAGGARLGQQSAPAAPPAGAVQPPAQPQPIPPQVARQPAQPAQGPAPQPTPPPQAATAPPVPPVPPAAPTATAAAPQPTPAAVTPQPARQALGPAEQAVNVMPRKTREALWRALSNSGMNRQQAEAAIKSLNDLPEGQNSMFDFELVRRFGQQYPRLKTNLQAMGRDWAITIPKDPRKGSPNRVLDDNTSTQIKSEGEFIDRTAQEVFGQPVNDTLDALGAGKRQLSAQYNSLLDFENPYGPNINRMRGQNKIKRMQEIDGAIGRLTSYLQRPEVMSEVPDWVRDRVMLDVGKDMRERLSDSAFLGYMRLNSPDLANLLQQGTPLRYSDDLWKQITTLYPTQTAHSLQSAYARAIRDALKGTDVEQRTAAEILIRKRGGSRVRANAASPDKRGFGLLHYLEEAVPGYRELRREYGDVIGAEDAAELPRDFFRIANDDVALKDWIEVKNDLSPQQQAALKSGMTTQIQQALRKKHETLDPWELDQPDALSTPNLTTLSQQPVLNALEKAFGADGKKMADAIRAASTRTDRIRSIHPNYGPRSAINQEAIRNASNIYGDPWGSEQNVIDSVSGSLGAAGVLSALNPATAAAAPLLLTGAAAKGLWNQWKRNKQLTGEEAEALADFFFRSRRPDLAEQVRGSRGTSAGDYAGAMLRDASIGTVAAAASDGDLLNNDPTTLAIGALGGAGVGAARAVSRNASSKIKPPRNGNRLASGGAPTPPAGPRPLPGQTSSSPAIIGGGVLGAGVGAAMPASSDEERLANAAKFGLGVAGLGAAATLGNRLLKGAKPKAPPSAPRSGPPGVKPPPVKMGFGGSQLPAGYKKSLAVVHNLSEANLLHADEIGGLAAPSLAVIDSDKGAMSGFGEVSLLADPNILKSGGIRTFDSDVYSPRHPRAEYKITDKKMLDFRDFINKETEGLGDLRGVDWDSVSREGPSALARNDQVRAAFLKSRGELPARLPRKKMPEDLGTEHVEAAKLPGAAGDRWEFRKNPDLVRIANRHYENEMVKLREIDPSMAKNVEDRIFDVAEDGTKSVSFTYIDRFAQDARRAKEALDGGVDATALSSIISRKMQNKKTADALDEYVSQISSNLFGERRLYKGMTDSGNRRYSPYTMENILREMTKTIRGGENWHYGAGSIRAKYARELKSLDEIRKNKDKLVASGGMEDAKKAIQDKLSDLIFTHLEKYYRFGGNRFSAMDEMSKAIADGPRALREVFDFKGNPEPMQRIQEFIDELKSMPTEYFEAKANRAVGLNEFAVAIVPRGASPKTIDALKRAGLKIKYYTKGDEASRAKAIQSEKQYLAGLRGNPEAIGAGAGAVLAPDVDGDGEVSFGERAGTAISGGVMGRGARAIGNRLGGAGRVKPPPVRGADQAGINRRNMTPAQAEIEKLRYVGEGDALETAAGRVSVQFEVNRRGGVQGNDRKIFLLDGKKIGFDALTQRIQDANSTPKPPVSQGFASGQAESRPKPPQTGNALAGKPPKGPPGTLSRMVAGGAVGGLAGSLGGDANAQEDLTGKISQTEQTIADLKKAMADLDKITDPFEKQRFLKAQGYYAGKIDGDIAGKTTEGMERWKAKKEAELEKAEAERKDLVRRDALQSNRPDPLMMALREYGPAVLGIGALFGMKYMRGGAAKASIKTAEAASNKLNKLITKGPVTGAMNKRDENRFANLNKLWQKGGASKEELPFKQDGAGKYKPNAKAKLPEELFADSGVWQTVTKYVKGKDVAIILGGGLDVAIAQPFIDKANENLSKAEAAWNDTPSDETAKALEDAKNEVAAYTLLQRIGMGVAAGRILGTFGGAYAKPMPNIPAAASEQAKLKQFIVSQKPPPKPRAKANPPAPKPRPKPRPKPPAPPAVPPTSQLPLPLKGGGKKKP